MKSKLFFIITSFILLAGIIVSVIEYFLAKKQEGLNVVGTGSSALPSATNVNLQLTALLADELDRLRNSNQSTIESLTNQINSFSQVHSSSITIEAGENLSKDSLVVIKNNKAYHFDSTVSENFSLSVGFILIDVTTGNNVLVYISGQVLTSTLLTINTKYYAGSNGHLTSTIDDNIGIQSIGYATSTNQLMLDFSERYSL